MSTAKREPQHRSAARQAHQPEGRPEITDEQLGLLPSDALTDEQDRVSDVIGPDRDDLELSEGADLEFAPQGGQRSGSRVQSKIIAEETDLTTTPHAMGEVQGALSEVQGTVAEVEPSWNDQPLITDPAAAVGDPDDASDPVSDLDETYTPPTDPVIVSGAHGEVDVLGGFGASADAHVRPRRSSDGQIGDEALVDAVLSALRHDAATTDLEIEVTAVQGVVRLRGTVPDLDDADNAEAVAAQVEGVVEVREQLKVASV